MTADFILNALGPGMLGPFTAAAVAPTAPGVVVLVERRGGGPHPLDVVETLDIAATVATGIGGRDERYAYALAFTAATDPAGYWRRAVAGTVCARLRDAGWRQLEITSIAMTAAAPR